MTFTATFGESSRANSSSLSRRRAVSTSGCPRRAYSRAMAAPMPLDAPVTNTKPFCAMVHPPAGSGRIIAPLDFAALRGNGVAMRRRLVAGNWKLHGDRAFARQLLDAVVGAPRPQGVQLVVLP